MHTLYGVGVHQTSVLFAEQLGPQQLAYPRTKDLLAKVQTLLVPMTKSIHPLLHLEGVERDFVSCRHLR